MSKQLSSHFRQWLNLKLLWSDFNIVQLTWLLECQGALGMESGTILDAQITVSSEWSENHAAKQGRLNFQQTGSKAGAWVAGTNDVNQWLQVDLGSQHFRVTGVATQGRNVWSQWVTRYKLQYSNDEVSFRCYIEQGQTTDKVKLHSGHMCSKTAIQKKANVFLIFMKYSFLIQPKKLSAWEFNNCYRGRSNNISSGGRGGREKNRVRHVRIWQKRSDCGLASPSCKISWSDIPDGRNFLRPEIGRWLSH